MSETPEERREWMREWLEHWWTHRPLWAYPNVDEVDEYLQKWTNEEAE